MTAFHKIVLITCCALFSHLMPAKGTGGAAEQGGANRIIAIGGSITEIIYALGAQDWLVAVDSTSMYPAAALARHPDVGYMRALSAEPVLSVNPDIILALSDAGPPEVLDQLQAAGVKVLTIPDEPSITGVYRKIRYVAGVLEREQRGAALISSIEQEYRDLANVLSRAKRKPDVLFLLSFGRGAPLAAGSATSAHGMISLAGGNNVMAGVSGYKAITPEAVIAAAPEIVVVLQRTFALYGDKEKLFALPELATTPAAKEGRLSVFDGLYLIGFGPRTVGAIRDLAAEFHPDLFTNRTFTSAQ
ncbi:MAG: ABC transporter substrate-binding protein [Gammaproteobacteria bacterium]|nr:ABC transporter substrate-binding protein [Gammaproteobacteria bacterium]MCY4282596.1 ABC transporter substrate-binding protein [Gammaproteobacteria bacterium]